MHFADAAQSPVPDPPRRTVAFEADLVRRYDRPGPRYTSYPTALQFRDDYASADHRLAVARANVSHPDTPLSAYLHLPFCASPCFFCGCTRIVTRQPETRAAYLAALHREIDIQASLFERRRPIEQLHLGGGTPTAYDDADLADLLQRLERGFGFVAPADREFSIEIDPRTVSAERLAGLASLGFNRISLGVQDFDPQVQAAVNRVQTPEQTFDLIRAGRRLGLRSISTDLIYGLPLQTVESFSRTLDRLIDERPDRIATYGYAHLPQKFTAQRRIRAEDLPGPALRLDLLQLTVLRLAEAGYVHIGMDHFALPDDELAHAAREGRLHRNFQGYSTRAGLDLVGMGMSAISHLGDAYSQNASSLREYETHLNAWHLAVVRGVHLSDDDRLRADVIQSLMCGTELRYEAFASRHGVEFPEYFADALERLETAIEDGLVARDDDALRITPRGRFLMRAVAMPFDAYAPAAAPGSGGRRQTHLA